MYSFDVFDTVITRNTATPGGIFVLVEDELLKNSLYADIPTRYRENFFILCRNAYSHDIRPRIRVTSGQANA